MGIFNGNLLFSLKYKIRIIIGVCVREGENEKEGDIRIESNYCNF